MWLIILLVAVFCLMQGFAYVDKKMKPPIMHLAKIRVKQIATEAINKAITAQVAEGKSTEGLIDWKTDTAGKVSGFMLNYDEHMRITASTMNIVQSTLQNVHMLKEKIPLGQALGSPVLASFGPNIPVRIEPQGAVKVDLNTRQQNAGINMILVEVYIHIIAEVAVVVPFDMEPETVDTEIPISYLLVVGDVPMYYYDNQGKPVGSNGSSAPSIALPSGQAGVSGGTGVTPNPSGQNQQQTPGGNMQGDELELEPDLTGENGGLPLDTDVNH
ncbi:sporulation protein YunB [Paenibacillus sp. 7523-1]|jgi:sporulation protein YunB|nr:sporulation protein YunB [Paenibacillus sp. 7523-1]